MKYEIMKDQKRGTPFKDVYPTWTKDKTKTQKP